MKIGIYPGGTDMNCGTLPDVFLFLLSMKLTTIVWGMKAWKIFYLDATIKMNVIYQLIKVISIKIVVIFKENMY